jgi:hypothetical protein
MDGKNVDSRVVVDEGGIQRVLFSMHSSLEEIQDLVQTLKPRKVTPIAKPDPVTTETVFEKKEILSHLKLGDILFIYRLLNFWTAK